MPRASRLVFAIGLALALTATLARADTAPATKLVVSWGTVAISNTPVWVAYKAGLFKKHGLDVDLQYVESTLQIPSLISGSVQIAQVGGTNVVSADIGGADLVILATLSPVFPYLFMVPSNIKTPAQLRGKAIGVSKFGDASHVGAMIAMSRAGVDPKDVTFVQVGSSMNRATALINGAISGGVIIPPIPWPHEFPRAAAYYFEPWRRSGREGAEQVRKRLYHRWRIPTCGRGRGTDSWAHPNDRRTRDGCIVAQTRPPRCYRTSPPRPYSSH